MPFRDNSVKRLISDYFKSQNMFKKTAVIIVNVGTPEKTSVLSVYKYLTAFLNDKRVIDIPLLFRFLLVNFIIIPFRINKSLGRYRKIWTAKGSPLLFHTMNLKDKLQAYLPAEYDVYAGMRYGNPSLKKTIEALEGKKYSKIIVLPLFPQYASATTGMIIEQIFNELSHWDVISNVRTISRFYDHPGFLEAFSEKIQACSPEKYDHVLFSFHSLPLNQIKNVHPDVEPENCSCIHEMPAHGALCYKASCYDTARRLAVSTGIRKESYSICFQSRFKGKWLSPFTEDVIIQKAGEGCKNLLVVSPSFTADCLETIYDITIEANELFSNHGGRKLHLVESLNDSDLWVKAIKEIVMNENCC